MMMVLIILFNIIENHYYLYYLNKIISVNTTSNMETFMHTRLTNMCVGTRTHTRINLYIFHYFSLKRLTINGDMHTLSL